MAAPQKPGNRWSDKEWREALRLAVMEPIKKGAHKGVKKLRRIATVVADAACEGESWAVTEVGNRLDGKPAQDMHVSGSVTHDLASLSDAELAARIKAELAALAGRGAAAKSEERLH